MFKAVYDLIKFYRILPKKRKIVFYSENESFEKFFSGIINVLIYKFNKDIYYITSSKNDPILKTKNKKIHDFCCIKTYTTSKKNCFRLFFFLTDIPTTCV